MRAPRIALLLGILLIAVALPSVFAADSGGGGGGGNPLPTCGDRICGNTWNENCVTCATDCRCGAGAICSSGGYCVGTGSCGDGSCGLDSYGQQETCLTCQSDCLCNSGYSCSMVTETCQRDPYCGDGICTSKNGFETSNNCCIDCGCSSGQECGGSGPRAGPRDEDDFGEACTLLCGNGEIDSGENCFNCLADITCSSGEACLYNSQTGYACTACEESCPSGYVCGTWTNSCGETLTCGSGCSSGYTCSGNTCQVLCGNGDVDPGEQCDGGACCTSSCNFASPGTDPGGQCSGSAYCSGDSVVQPGLCGSGGSCGYVSSTCSNGCISGSCLSEGSCTSNAHCANNPGRPYCSGNTCVQCTQDSHCGSGNRCENNVCVANQICGNGNQESPEGCDDGNTINEGCSAPYGGSCNYCGSTCQTVTVNGPYNGDNICNGPEACDTHVGDCGVCRENSPALCSNGINDDFTQDSQTNYADASPGIDAGQSCNICDASACDAAGGVPLSPQCGVGQPSTVNGVEYFNGASARPGTGTSLRLDCDGTAGASSCWCARCASGFTWDGSACVSDEQYCCENNPGPSITSFSGSPASGYSLQNIALTLQGAGGCGPLTFEIDTNQNPSVYESSGGSSPHNAQVNNLAQGTYTYYARITDYCGPDMAGRSDTDTTTVTVNPNPAPTIGTFTAAVTPVWEGNAVAFNIAVSDNRNSFQVRLNFGDGTPDYTATSAGTSWSNTINHDYGQGDFTATLTITDSGSPVKVVQDTEGIPGPGGDPLGLQCVPGTHDGNATYDNMAEQCCTPGGNNNPNNYESCPAQESGTWSCFAVSACYPTDQSICSSNPTPTEWRDRDFDQVHCEASSASCTQYTWTTQSGVPMTAPLCCGDDGSENLAVFSNNGQDACCSAPNQCYTTAGAAPGCYNGAENSVVLCSDGNDNDCDGAVDENDIDCQPSLIYGQVTIDDQGSPSIAIGANVTISGVSISKSTNTIGNYSFSASELLGTSIEEHTVYAFKFGYSTEQESVDFRPGQVYNVDFVLESRRCNADCTNDQGFCDSSCIGVGECQPTAAELQTLDACHPPGAAFGLQTGTEVVLAENETSQELLVGICCSVAPSWRSAPAVTVVDAGSADVNMQRIDTLVKYTRLITLNGKTYRLVISTW